MLRRANANQVSLPKFRRSESENDERTLKRQRADWLQIPEERIWTGTPDTSYDSSNGIVMLRPEAQFSIPTTKRFQPLFSKGLGKSSTSAVEKYHATVSMQVDENQRTWAKKMEQSLTSKLPHEQGPIMLVKDSSVIVHPKIEIVVESPSSSSPSTEASVFENLGALAKRADNPKVTDGIEVVNPVTSNTISDSVKVNSDKVSKTLLAFQGFVGVSVGISTIFGIAAALSQMIATYESVQIIPYEFKTREGISLYWDGTRVSSRVWGLDNTIDFSIADLKLVTTNVISGYTANEAGLYHNGKFYKDTHEVRKMQAHDLVKAIQAIDYSDANSWDKSFANVVWKIELAGFDQDLTFVTLQDLIDTIAEHETLISPSYSSLYNLLGDKVTASESAVVDDVIRVLRQNLKPILVFKLPELDESNRLILGRFQLPAPYYSNGRRFEKPLITDESAYERWKQASAKYLIYSQNLNREWLNLEASKAKAERDILYEYFAKIFNSDIQDAYATISREQIAKITIEEKITTLTAVLQANQFAELANQTEQAKLAVHSFVDASGKVRFFTSEAAALEALQNENQVALFQNDNDVKQVAYIYNEQRYDSLAAIYQVFKNN